jgi:hypothetical protein
MKINVERGALLKALNHVQSVVERRNTIPILSNVLIEAAKGELKLTATDLDIEIVEALPADVLRNGSATAPAHMLYDIVRKLPDGAQARPNCHQRGGRCIGRHSRLNCPACRGRISRRQRAPCRTNPPGGQRPQAIIAKRACHFHGGDRYYLNGTGIPPRMPSPR